MMLGGASVAESPVSGASLASGGFVAAVLCSVLLSGVVEGAYTAVAGSVNEPVVISASLESVHGVSVSAGAVVTPTGAVASILAPTGATNIILSLNGLATAAMPATGTITPFLFFEGVCLSVVAVSGSTRVTSLLSGVMSTTVVLCGQGVGTLLTVGGVSAVVTPCARVLRNNISTGSAAGAVGVNGSIKALRLFSTAVSALHGRTGNVLSALHMRAVGYVGYGIRGVVGGRLPISVQSVGTTIAPVEGAVRVDNLVTGGVVGEVRRESLDRYDTVFVLVASKDFRRA